MASRKPGGLDMVVLQLRHMEDGVDAHVGRKRQLVGNRRDDGGDPKGAKPSRCQLANLSARGEREVGFGEEDLIAHLICLRLSMLIGVLFLAILGGDQVLSGVLKCRCNSSEEVVSGWGCCRLRPEKTGGGERVLTRI
jgi:hypothetical protein